MCGFQYLKLRSESTDLDVLGEEIVAVGPVVEHDLVEGGWAQFQHLAVVVTPVFVLADDPLPNCQLPHGSLVALRETETQRYSERLSAQSVNCHIKVVVMQ